MFDGSSKTHGRINNKGRDKAMTRQKNSKIGSGLTVLLFSLMIGGCTTTSSSQQNSERPKAAGGRADFERELQHMKDSGELKSSNLIITYSDGTKKTIQDK